MALIQLIVSLAIQEFIIIQVQNNVFAIQPVKLVMGLIQVIVYLVIQENIITQVQNNVFAIQPVKLVMAQIQIIVCLVIQEFIIIQLQNNVFVIQLVKLVMVLIQVIVQLAILLCIINKAINRVQFLVIKTNSQIKIFIANHAIVPVQVVMEKTQTTVNLAILTPLSTTKAAIAFAQMDFKVFQTNAILVQIIIGLHNAMPAMQPANYVTNRKFQINNAILAMVKLDILMQHKIVLAKIQRIKEKYFINAVTKPLQQLMHNQAQHLLYLQLIQDLP
ncbi:transmembrane protein, putative (macronuclear) [Tetrahymena thermophila SB210]|uniref:Transmembrane protein, putative n=1 Tax=Tetrahymena thermophila (strain SB210) TaxID=312017 RepID=W7XIZ2_TETTS|nr:transmembrane protein, putative [Tetrahymena thermophila SB210]EWS73729.1 transmembrane protein, putative [Tetrahymena thermophila SB210]|eukprot:XP_012653767.1 transmembrane protein, putative [Tetrahymena thermophila SB210]